MILNLTNPIPRSNIEILYKISKFPDGQQSIEIEDFPGPKYDAVIEIRSRLNSFRDLELIICATQALKGMGCKHISLFIPYVLGGRSDRQFVRGGVNYLKQVICPIINSQGYDSVSVLDPHSDVIEACLNNFIKYNNFNLVDDALSYLIKDGEDHKVALVSPDAGAMKKIFDVAKKFDITNVTTATKVRDIKTGNILRTELPTMDLDGIEYIVIIDDICDGGRTFTELAKEIKKQTNKPIYLIVTHGIFSGGFEKLSDELDGIFCTNSIKDINFETVKVQSRQNDLNFVKQLNIF